MRYEFKAAVWQYNPPRGWYFVSLPQAMAAEIRQLYRPHHKAWGRLPIQAKVASTMWRTALWFDSQSTTYVLPIKTVIRNSLRIETNSQLVISINLL